MSMSFFTNNNTIILTTLIALFVQARIIIGNKIIIQLFKLSLTKEKEILLYIIEVIGTVLFYFIFSKPMYIIMDIILLTALNIKILKLEIEKAILAEVINIILICLPESITSKIGAIIINNINYNQETNIIICKILISASPAICKFILYMTIKKQKLVIKIENCIDFREKAEMILILVTSLILIEATTKGLITNIYLIPSIVYWIVVFLLIAYFIVVIGNIMKISKIENNKKQIENLEGSNERLQNNYDDIRAFRHDFNNIMQSIGGYIAIKDLGGLENMYKSIIKECQDINNSQGINKENINNPAIYNLINSKYRLTNNLGIKMKVEVLINLNNLKVCDYDLCRILGILMDNAIEATKECDEKIISIKFIRDKINERDLIIIENPCKNYLIDVKKIYEKGFSTKKDKICHGLGLWKVQQILKKNKNLQIYTARDNLFKQQLEIY